MLEVLFIGTDAIVFVGNNFYSKVNAMHMFVLPLLEDIPPFLKCLFFFKSSQTRFVVQVSHVRMTFLLLTYSALRC